MKCINGSLLRASGMRSYGWPRMETRESQLSRSPREAQIPGTHTVRAYIQGNWLSGHFGLHCWLYRIKSEEMDRSQREELSAC